MYEIISASWPPVLHAISNADMSGSIIVSLCFVRCMHFISICIYHSDFSLQIVAFDMVISYLLQKECNTIQYNTIQFKATLKCNINFILRVFSSFYFISISRGTFFSWEMNSTEDLSTVPLISKMEGNFVSWNVHMNFNFNIFFFSNWKSHFWETSLWYVQ